MVIYTGIGGVQKEIGSLYAGIGGTSKELNNVYAGIGGISKEIYKKGFRLNKLSPGSLLKLNETVGGITTAVPYIVLAHDHHYQNTTSLVRKDVYSLIPWDSNGDNVYTTSSILSWLLGTFSTYLDSGLPIVNSANIPYAYNISTGGYNVSFISLKIFLLSVMELGLTHSDIPYLGTAIPYFSSDASRIAKLSGVAKEWWTRSPYVNTDEKYIFRITTGGQLYTGITNRSPTYSYGVRPALCLYYNLTGLISQETDVDGCYTFI